MEETLSCDQFLDQSIEGVILDVRSPAEYEHGHIPGAFNLPLFSNEERAEIGTLYVQTSRDAAVLRGLELVGPKMADLVRQAQTFSEGKTLYLYCWRGGMRSGSMAWLLRTAGMQVRLLQGGYKAYRNAFLQMLTDIPWKMVVIGGLTGCGKTDILHQLQADGHQVIDLEKLAHHKGSAFGNLGETAQPDNEQFINDLHHCMRNFDSQKPVWVEGESASIGKVYMPQEFRAQMLKGTFIKFEIPLSFRIENIMRDYGHFSTDELIASFQKLEKRMGRGPIMEAEALLHEGKIEEAMLIALDYYDKSYSRSMNKLWQKVNNYTANTNDPKSNAAGVLNFYKSIKKDENN